MNFGFSRLKKPFLRFRAKKSKADKKPRSTNSVLALSKHAENPILHPKSTNGWEAWQVFNPGVILIDNKVHFLYRAIGEDGQSRLGYAVSSDGLTIDERLSYPVYEHCNGVCTYSIYSYVSGGSWGGCEDPRIVRVDNEDTIYITYTACENGLRVALNSIKVDDFLNKRWKWKLPKLISKPNEVHKNWVIFPEKINGRYAILHSISPEILVTYTDDLEFEQEECIESYYDGGRNNTKYWDNWVRGSGPPPIRTKFGWLLFYHAMDARDPGKYKVGAMLLDLNDPTKVVVRSREPILEPKEDYEYNGYKPGVVYAIGAVVKDGKLFVYYGGADNYVCVATADFDEFVTELKNHVKPRLIRMLLR